MKPREVDRQERKPGLLERGWDRFQQFIEDDRKKLGGMHLGAMWRLGLAELREAFNWPGGTIAQPTPYGMAGTLTPGEVYSARRARWNAQTLEEGTHMDTNRMPSPSEIAYGKDLGGQGQEQPRLLGQEQSSVHGGQDQSPSPSQIADRQEPYTPEQQHGQEHEHGMER